MKNIETRYAGYKFRSRTEARWAVFFDSMGIEWEYELEGFVLDNGKCFLPDFYLPKHKYYAEVKPYNYTGLTKEIKEHPDYEVKWVPFSRGAKLLLLQGVPNWGPYRALALLDYLEFREGKYIKDKVHGFCWSEPFVEYGQYEEHNLFDSVSVYGPVNSSKIDKAIQFALSARFEFNP